MAKIVLAIAIAIWLWPGLCAAGEAEWKSSIDAGSAALQRSDYVEATSQFRAAAREAELFTAVDARLGRGVSSGKGEGSAAKDRFGNGVDCLRVSVVMGMSSREPSLGAPNAAS